MSFHDDYNSMLTEYLTDNVEISFISYIPFDGSDVNIDVHEVKEFNLRIVNNGDLRMSHVIVQVTASGRGQMSQSFAGFANMINGGWMNFQQTITLRDFDVGPSTTEVIVHAQSGGKLFAFKADETTGGTDGNRDVEDLMSMEIALWQADIKNALYSPEPSPSAVYSNFIQRD